MTPPEHAFTTEPADGELAGAGLRLHYLDWGLANGPPILFLHGGGLNAHTWDVVADLLHGEFGCVALDLRGHGDSDWHEAGDYSLQSHVADVVAAADALALDRFALVGMSLGGVVALVYAAEHPARVSRLVLVDTGPGGSRPAGRRRLGQFMEGPEEFGSVDEIIDRAIAFNPRRSRDRLRRTLMHNLRQTPRGTWTWKYDQRIRRLGRREALTEAEIDRQITQRSALLWQAASRVACPTLIVRGGESDMFHDEDAERAVAGFRDAHWVRVEGASHTVQSDHPYELAEALRGFLGYGVRRTGDGQT